MCGTTSAIKVRMIVNSSDQLAGTLAPRTMPAPVPTCQAIQTMLEEPARY